MKTSELIKELEKRLRAHGDCEVVMQREADYFNYSPLAGVVAGYIYAPDNDTGHDLIDPEWEGETTDDGVTLNTPTGSREMRTKKLNQTKWKNYSQETRGRYVKR